MGSVQQIQVVYDMVADAIRSKKTVVAVYDGHRRVMCPHVLGMNNEGRFQCLFYQYEGTSRSGLAPAGSPKNWRCIPLEGLIDVSVMNGEWHTGANHSRPQTCVAVKDVEVEI